MSQRRRARGATPRASALAPLATLLALATAGCGPAGGEAADAGPRNEDQRALYALGVAASRPLEPFTLSPDEAEHVAAGFRDALSGESVEAQPEAYRSQIEALGTQRREAALADEKTRAEAFVTRAAQQEGAVQTPSGLVYLEERPGEGAAPEPTSTVVVHYHGTLPDGTVFDSSVDRGEPARFPLNRVIQCWQEGVGRLREGGKARIVCPSSLAYGDMGAPPRIPGGAALQFDVELLEVVPNEPLAAPEGAPR